MKIKRIIPCLDTKDGRVVKGTNFVSLKELGDPVTMAKTYSDEGADELVLLDITATNEARQTKLDLVKQVKKAISIPLSVGGGISSIHDISDVLNAGADKVSINSAAVNHPELIDKSVTQFGSERIIIAIDAKQIGRNWHVMTRGGMKDTEIDAIKWAKEVVKRGAGEILLTSMDRDGVKSGFDLDLTKAIVDAVDIPVIASGGVGSADDFVEAFQKTDVAAALAASIFHEGTYTVKEVKQLCKENGVSIREA
ncbi:imidazole glycerol phosphate synthase subunit HisF [Amphibacillus sp. Q70]|uniref:imidazole glycerol phosphate synthase subunit HisF n=1 Tax=Amphibacillus sp. Q70 TaxID=3453416 RepID=UPI003F859EAE